MTHFSQTSRRQFLKTTATASAAMAAPYFVRASALGLENKPAASERIVMGCIGTGGKGRNNLQRFMKFGDVQVVAVCDVDGRHMKTAQNMVNKHYGKDACAALPDFRELVARKDVDAVSIATPDHWHALTSIAAANAGKDVYCEKPLANSVAEGRAICDAVEKNKVILQTGSHERSNSNARFACELVRNGRIGKLHTMHINMPADQNHHQKVRDMDEKPPAQPVPEFFDYDFWLGHTPKAPYTPLRTHFWWRFILAYGGGEMTDRGAHIIDLAQLGAGTDDTGPTRIEATGRDSDNGIYDAFMDYDFACTYASGLRMIGKNQGPRGVKFEGDQGSIFIHVHGGKLQAEPASLLKTEIGKDDVSLGRSPGHHRNFIDCVKSRKTPFAPAEVGHRTATICHLANIAMRVGRPLTWNPKNETIADDSQASSLLAPKMRAPWKL